jgi:hypothetical protein
MKITNQPDQNFVYQKLTAALNQLNSMEFPKPLPRCAPIRCAAACFLSAVKVKLPIKAFFWDVSREPMKKRDGGPHLSDVSLGLAGGLALAAISVRLIKSQLYGVQIYDPVTFVAVLLMLILAAAAATFLPTRKIALIDPASTLRAE